MADNSEWWRGAVIYQIYPRSFYDASGDGVGDLAGIREKLPYIADLGVDAVWLSPFYQSPMADFGYDISDFYAVDPLFGTLGDFDALVAEAHRLGLRVVVDQVLSHTAATHPWFAESASGRDNAKSDWYVWAEPAADGCPPNNWLSNFGGPAWEWNAKRRQYYLHNFLVSQPDLNFHNPEVRAEMLGVLKFWLDRGVDGFRLDTVNYFFHDTQLRDNPPLPPGVEFVTAPKSNPYSYQDHVYDKTRPENLAFLEEVRRLTDSYDARMLVGELGVDGPAVGPMLASYTQRGKRLHMCYSFELLADAAGSDHIRDLVERLNREIGDGWICWSMSNHDVARVMTRWGMAAHAERAAPLLWALLVSLRGSACVYQGEELGLTEADVPYDRIQDPYGKVLWPEFKGRDGCRTPMVWDAYQPHGGFSTAEPWLPVPAEHLERSVAAQRGRADSCLERIRRFNQWRKEWPELGDGEQFFLPAPNNILMFRRVVGGNELLAAFNLGAEEKTFAVPELDWKPLDGHGFTGEITGGQARLAGFDALFYARGTDMVGEMTWRRTEVIRKLEQE